MKLSKSKSSTREQPAEDNYFARIVSVTNLGVQPGFLYMGEMTRPSHKMEVTYELVTTQMSDGRPFWVSEELPASASSKKAAQRFQAYGIPIDSDLHDLLGKPVMVTVVHSEKGYANVRNVAGVPGGISVPDLRNPSFLFDPWGNDLDVDKFNAFPEFKRERIQSATNFEESKLFKTLVLEEEGEI